ncbi:MAG TPA: LysR family transcriptional regulator [Paracoccaceae bacterium]|nr:LysR family transcriptional regulator [Paracoccaceae bacterium]
MDLLDQLRAFVATAQSGSFTGAATQLGISNRLASKYVAELEQRLGVRLFQRTTRKVGLSPAGTDLLSRAPALLDDLDDLLADVSDSSKDLSGVLRVSAPITFGEVYIAGMLARFAEKHPGITIDLRLSDAFSDLAAEGIDLAFRIGRFDMASLKVRRLGAFQSLPVASPAYLALAGRPTTPTELAEHSCIIDTNRRNPMRWVFDRNGTEVVAQIKGRFHVNSASAAVDLARRGLGIAYVPSFALSDALDSGDLVKLLDNYTGESADIGAAYLEGRILPRKVRVLIDFAVLDIGTAKLLQERAAIPVVM